MFQIRVPRRSDGIKSTHKIHFIVLRGRSSTGDSVIGGVLYAGVARAQYLGQ